MPFSQTFPNLFSSPTNVVGAEIVGTGSVLWPRMSNHDVYIAPLTKRKKFQILRLFHAEKCPDPATTTPRVLFSPRAENAERRMPWR